MKGKKQTGHFGTLKEEREAFILSKTTKKRVNLFLAHGQTQLGGKRVQRRS